MYFVLLSNASLPPLAVISQAFVRIQRLAITSFLLITMSLTISGCSGVSPVKQSEEDGGEDMSIDSGMAVLFAAEGFASNAARQNDDYARLSDAVTVLVDSLVSGSEAMANTAWVSVANIYNGL
jgi:hypothetical protein